MSRKLIASLALFAALSLTSGMAAAQVNADDFGAAPDLSVLDQAPTDGNVSRWGVGKAKLPAPGPRAACITPEAENAALAGTGCDCSCDGYARQLAGPASETCDIVCGIPWYACWAPDPTDTEIRETILAGLEDYDEATRVALAPIMLAQLDDPEAYAGLRGGQMMGRALAWDETRKCPRD